MEKISLIYYINFFLLAFLTCFVKKSSKGLFLFVCTYLSVLVAIRYNVGTDYVNYVRLYDETSFKTLFNDISQIEYGAFGSMALFKSLGLGIPWWFFMMSMMTLLTLFRGLNRLGVGNVWWSLLIYYSFFFLMNQCNLMQHGAMTGWVWLAFSYIKEHDLKHFLIYCLIGASFHILGLFMIPFYWLLNKNISLKYVFVAFGLAIAFNLFIQQFLFSILDFGYIGAKVQFYQEVYFKDQEIDKSLSMGMILYALLLVCLYIYKINKGDESFRILRNALLFSLFFQVGFKGTGIFDARIGGVFNISLIVIIPVFFITLSKNFFKPIKLVILLYAFMMFFVTTTNPSIYYNNGYQFIPYNTIFDKNETNR